MPFGQSFFARKLAKGIAEAMGADKEEQVKIGRAVGWAVALTTFDLHFQGVAEAADILSDVADGIDIDDAFDYDALNYSDSDTYVSSESVSDSYVQPKFGSSVQSVCTGCGGTGEQRCHICSGQGYSRWPSSGEPEQCWTCSGTGHVNCWTCGGDGLV